jgi:branched-chain amino acid transport system permease protein
MADLFQLLVNGLAIGSVYALAAIGFVIVYSATGVVNFAAGQFVMLGTFAGVAMLVNARDRRRPARRPQRGAGRLLHFLCL